MNTKTLALIDPGLLTTFMAVADAGSISAASRLLHLSQPAVTAQIQKLEHEVKVPLLMRSVKGISLTHAGTQLLGYSRQIANILERALAELRPQTNAAGTLVMAASTTIAAHVLPTVIAGFRKQYPEVSVRLEVGNTQQVVNGLSSGAIPIGLVEGHARAAQLRLQPFVDDEIVCVVAKNYPGKIRTVHDLSTVPILWREPGSGTRAVVEKALRAKQIRRGFGPLDMQLGCTEAIKGAICAELGAGFLSRWSIQTEVKLGMLRVVPLAGVTIRRSFRWALPAGGVVGVASVFYDYANKCPPVLG